VAPEGAINRKTYAGSVSPLFEHSRQEPRRKERDAIAGVTFGRFLVKCGLKM
jgi:hypothetical protein